jgi:hypothetical protein
MAEQNNKPSEVDTKAQDLSERWLIRLRNLPLFAGLIVLGAGAVQVGRVWDALPDGFKAAVVSWIPLHTLDEQSSKGQRDVPSDYGVGFFNGTWHIQTGYDEELDNFKPRYKYTGDLSGKTKSGKLFLEGPITTNKQDGTLSGVANFVYEGAISNNQSAGYFTYTNETVKGFGSCFIEFDSAGNGTMYLYVRTTRTLPGEGDVARVRLIIERLK